MINNFRYYETRFLISRLLTMVNRFIDRFGYTFGWGFCLHCFRFTFNLHNDSDVSYHCNNCCKKIYPNLPDLWNRVFLMRNCCCCGKEFEVEVDGETKKIITDCLYGGTIRLGVGNWSHSKAKQDESGNLVLDKDGLIIWEKCNPWWRELKYRLIDLKRTILHQYVDAEYWECPECLNRIREENAKEKT